MAMEIEYADIDTDDTPTPFDTDDAASIVNGNGCVDADASMDAAANSQALDAGIADLVIDNQEEWQQAHDTSAAIALSDLVAGDSATMDERRAAAEEMHVLEISDAKEEHFSLAVKRSELEAALKECKSEEKAALKNLKNLIRRGPSYPQPATAIEQAVAGVGNGSGNGTSAIQVDDPSEDQTWRLIPTSQVIDGIKGMGAKKAEAIISLAPTLGDLEELRAQAGMAFKPLASVLPKGVGGTLADDIEERIFDAMKKHKEQLALLASA